MPVAQAFLKIAFVQLTSGSQQLPGYMQYSYNILNILKNQIDRKIGGQCSCFYVINIDKKLCCWRFAGFLQLPGAERHGTD